MRRGTGPFYLLAAVAVGFLLGLADFGWAQRPRRPVRRPSRPAKKEPPPPRPTDPLLIELYKEFLTKAEKLAARYEKERKWDQALEVYESILRLVPRYAKAEAAVKRIRARQATARQKRFTVRADRGWQDTGVIVLEGKPITISASGTWVFKMEHRVSPDGIPIPKELRDFNLGALVGMIVGPDPKQNKPFVVGSNKSFVAPRTGRLLLRMYDSNPSDNDGTLSVTIQGTFQHAE